MKKTECEKVLGAYLISGGPCPRRPPTPSPPSPPPRDRLGPPYIR